MKTRKYKSVYICEKAWKIYDVWASLPEGKEKEAIHAKFVLHRNTCNLCTPYEKPDDNTGI